MPKKGGVFLKFKWNQTGNGKEDNLGRQLEKILRNVNQGSFETRYRYIAAEKRFITHVAEKFNLQKLQNIQDKHLESYVKELKSNGCSDKYIKNELSGIRYIHNQTTDTKYTLSDSKTFNDKVLELGSTKDGRADRAWTDKEYNAILKIAQERNRLDIGKTLAGIKNTGMRLDEVCTVKRNQIEESLRTGKLHLENTKGGRPRDIVLTDKAKDFLEKAIQDVPRGGYVFTPVQYWDKGIQKYEASVQGFIYAHRDKVQEPDRANTAHNIGAHERGALTAHGLRHTYARDELDRLKEGMPEHEARQILAEELGHGRESVTEIYVPQN